MVLAPAELRFEKVWENEQRRRAKVSSLGHPGAAHTFSPLSNPGEGSIGGQSLSLLASKARISTLEWRSNQQTTQTDAACDNELGFFYRLE